MIYQIFHKQMPNEYYCSSATPLLVGRAEADIQLKTRDYFPTISHLNPLYGETEAINYIRNFDNDAVKGLFTYRRWITENEIPTGYDGIAVPITLKQTLQRNYNGNHIEMDLVNAKTATLSLYPDYEQAWHQFIEKGNKLYYGGGCILKGKVFDEYATWLWSILEALRVYYGFKTMQDVEDYVSSKRKENVPYQSRFFGFLAERLTTLYFLKNLKIKDTNYKLMEGLKL